MISDRRITDQASLTRQGLLLAAMTAVGAHWRVKADEERTHGHILHALGCERTAWRFEQIAGRTRKRLVAASGLTVQDIAAEPADSCPIPDCPSWEHPTSPPPAYQANPTPVCRTVEETVSWLRWEHPEMWFHYPYLFLVKLARWLLILRQRCWEGRWTP